VGLTLRLLQLFYLSRRPLKFDRLSMSAHYRHFSQVSLPFSEFVHHHNCPLLLSNHPGGRCSDLRPHTTSVTVLHLFELHDMSMGHARLVCTQFYFFHTLGKAWVLQVPLSFQWVTLDTPHNALSYTGTLSRRNIDVFRLYVCS
jgi:hypothetical protein